jgi:hypothetical protein
MTVSIEPLRVLRIDWGRAFAWLKVPSHAEEKCQINPYLPKRHFPPQNMKQTEGQAEWPTGLRVRSNPGSLSTVSALWRRLAAIRNSPARS